MRGDQRPLPVVLDAAHVVLTDRPHRRDDPIIADLRDDALGAVIELRILVIDDLGDPPVTDAAPAVHPRPATAQAVASRSLPAPAASRTSPSGSGAAAVSGVCASGACAVSTTCG